jgi:hypothetical protein
VLNCFFLCTRISLKSVSSTNLHSVPSSPS